MKGKLRIAVTAAAVIAVLAILFCLLYYWLIPKFAYRKLVFSVADDGSVSSAEAVTSSGEYPLSEEQILAVVSWLAEYRSENDGISRASEHEGYELRLHFSDGQKKDKVLYVEQAGVVFEGMLGRYRVETEDNEIYDLIKDMVRR